MARKCASVGLWGIAMITRGAAYGQLGPKKVCPLVNAHNREADVLFNIAFG
jgi:hypothetical protein